MENRYCHSFLTTVKNKPVWVLVILALLMCSISFATKNNIERLALSVRNYKIAENIRITEFRVTIKHGFVVSAPKIPPGWFMNLSLPTQEESVVSAGSVVGVADLTSEDASYFSDFLIIEAPQGQELDMSVEIKATDSDGRIISSFFKKEDLRLEKILGR